MRDRGAVTRIEGRNPLSNGVIIRRRTDRLNHRRFPQFSRRLRCASLHSADEKIGSPVARCAAASRWLTRPARRRSRLHLSQDQEDEMSIEQQIEELRAELSWCDDAVERQQIEAELRAIEKCWKRSDRTQRRAEKADWQQAGPSPAGQEIGSGAVRASLPFL